MRCGRDDKIVCGRGDKSKLSAAGVVEFELSMALID